MASFYPRALRTKIKTVTAPNVFRHSSILSITVLSHVSKDSALYVITKDAACSTVSLQDKFNFHIPTTLQLKYPIYYFLAHRSFSSVLSL